MGVEQVYNPMSGINRMVTDIENFMEPLLFEFHPVLHVISKMNLQIVSALFIILMFYILVIKRHSLIKRLKTRETYIISIAGLIVFALLNSNPIRFGPSFSFNFGIIVMPVISKFLGPVVAAIFGICQYGLQFLKMDGQAFSLSSMLIGSISGIFYAMFIYDKRTKYSRCFLAKLVVNILCNILLVPLAASESMTTELAEFITDRIIENIFLVPIQALVIYGALKIVKKLRRYI